MPRHSVQSNDRDKSHSKNNKREMIRKDQPKIREDKMCSDDVLGTVDDFDTLSRKSAETPPDVKPPPFTSPDPTEASSLEDNSQIDRRIASSHMSVSNLLPLIHVDPCALTYSPGRNLPRSSRSFLDDHNVPPTQSSARSLSSSRNLSPRSSASWKGFVAKDGASQRPSPRGGNACTNANRLASPSTEASLSPTPCFPKSIGSISDLLPPTCAPPGTRTQGPRRPVLSVHTSGSILSIESRDSIVYQSGLHRSSQDEASWTNVKFSGLRSSSSGSQRDSTSDGDVLRRRKQIRRRDRQILWEEDALSPVSSAAGSSLFDAAQPRTLPTSNSVLLPYDKHKMNNSARASTLESATGPLRLSTEQRGRSWLRSSDFPSASSSYRPHRPQASVFPRERRRVNGYGPSAESCTSIPSSKGSYSTSVTERRRRASIVSRRGRYPTRRCQSRRSTRIRTTFTPSEISQSRRPQSLWIHGDPDEAPPSPLWFGKMHSPRSTSMKTHPSMMGRRMTLERAPPSIALTEPYREQHLAWFYERFRTRKSVQLVRSRDVLRSIEIPRYSPTDRSWFKSSRPDETKLRPVRQIDPILENLGLVTPSGIDPVSDPCVVAMRDRMINGRKGRRLAYRHLYEARVEPYLFRELASVFVQVVLLVSIFIVATGSIMYGILALIDQQPVVYHHGEIQILPDMTLMWH